VTRSATAASDVQQAEPYLQVVWTDPVSGRRGYLVIDTLVRGVCSGGLRMRAGCTLDEVRGLAAGMTAKEALNYDPDARYVPLGGAKGGIDCNPYDADARAVLSRYLTAMRPYVERHWTLGEDLGLRQSTIDEVCAELGLDSCVQAVFPLLADVAQARQRLEAAFAVEVDGVSLDELAGGCGVAEAVLAGLDRLGLAPQDSRVVLQGFGSMGGATARFLAAAGLRVVGIADTHGVVANPDGLDVERLLLTRDRHGAVDRSQLRPEDEQLPREAWLTLDAEVLVPAAVSYAIGEQEAAQVTAALIVEAANMPVLPAAEPVLTARGVLVVPDVVANSATNSWWWWTLFGDIEADADAAFAKIRSRMRTLVSDVLAEADSSGTTTRAAAAALAARASAALRAGSTAGG
jgi:glutamate dehydrogenase (NAD(P)+)